LRGREGTVERVFEGDYAYFCHTGDGIGDPMPIYIVTFAADELFGERAEGGPLTINAELFEAYMEGI
jgi:nitrile hydratase